MPSSEDSCERRRQPPDPDWGVDVLDLHCFSESRRYRKQMKKPGSLLPDPEACAGSSGRLFPGTPSPCSSPRLSWGDEGSLFAGAGLSSPLQPLSERRSTTGSLQRRSYLAALRAARPASRQEDLVSANTDALQTPKEDNSSSSISSFKLSLAEGGVPYWYQTYMYGGGGLRNCPAQAVALVSRTSLLAIVLLLLLLFGAFSIMEVSTSETSPEAPKISDRPGYLYIRSTALLQGHNFRASLGHVELLKFRQGVSVALNLDIEDVQIISIGAAGQPPALLHGLWSPNRDIRVEYEIAVPSAVGVFNYSRVLHQATISGALKEALTNHGIACNHLVSRHIIHHKR
mmetsp:Transcript_14196/g.40240  ORF Transcript_14196/g.40240 Transcript_14196/m.40240 type:complete len:344 (-) Transcript_14196:207-1238(-)